MAMLEQVSKEGTHSMKYQLPIQFSQSTMEFCQELALV